MNANYIPQYELPGAETAFNLCGELLVEHHAKIHKQAEDTTPDLFATSGETWRPVIRPGTSALQAELAEHWSRIMPMERRTRAAFAHFVKTELLKAGKDVFPAVDDAAGNCIYCGESGRCPGWHYHGE